MFRILVIGFFMLGAALPIEAQQRGVGPGEPSAKEELRIRKQRRKEAKAKRKLEKEEQKKIRKHHKRLQTKQVNKRMKKSRKTALRNNDNRREFFMKRWFTRKGKPARQTRKKD